MIIKILSTLYVLFGSYSLYSQNDKMDLDAIKFKASLLTISEYGIANKEQILKDIENQEVVVLKTKYKNFLFVRVKFSQPYRLSNTVTTTLNRNCYYYIGFDIKKKIFYRLGGFDSVDIDLFIDALERAEKGNIFYIEGGEIEDINITCLYEYHSLNRKKRFKKGFNCFENCSENTKTYYLEH